MATYTFRFSGRDAGKSINVYDVTTSAQVASGSADANAVLTVSLPTGEYYALSPDGRYVRGGVDSPQSVESASMAATYVRRTQQPIPGRGVVVFTWDDGTADHFDVATEAAARGQAHTFFVNAGTVGTAGFLTSAQIQAMSGQGHEIGNHCNTHLDMTTLTVAQREAQYDNSKASIEGWIGAGKCRSIAYPYGFHNTAIDQETALRYDRSFLVNNVNQAWRQPISKARSHNVNRLQWASGTSHQAALQAIRAAQYQDTVTMIMGHQVGQGGVLTRAEMIEALDLAQSLGVRCVTAADALPCSNRFMDPGFELPLGAWITSGTASVVADTPMPGMGGLQSLKLTSTANSYTEAVQSIPVDRIEPMTLSGRYHSDQATGLVHVIVRPFGIPGQGGAGGQLTPDAQVNLGVPLPWTRFSLSFTPPAGTVALQVFFFVQDTGNAYIDHLWLAPDTHGALG